MDFRVVLVITPIVFAWIFTVFWLGRWDVFRLTGRPSEGYPVFTVRTAAVNALGIPTVFFLGAILAMQFKSY